MDKWEAREIGDIFKALQNILQQKNYKEADISSQGNVKTGSQGTVNERSRSSRLPCECNK